MRRAALPLLACALGWPLLSLEKLRTPEKWGHATPPLLLLQSAAPRAPPAELHLEHIRREGSGYVAELPDGRHTELTLDPRLQAFAEQLIEERRAPYAAAVALSLDDGRLLALAGRSLAEPARSAASLCLEPWAPAASIFKLVTAAALVDRGVLPSANVCYHDGVHSVEESNLHPSPRFDRSCNTLAYGVAMSQNAILARLAYQHLDAPSLDRTARAFGFGAALPFQTEVPPSTITVPERGLPFARVAAGFWQSTLSPLHGAYLAATIARGGTTPPIHIAKELAKPESQRALDPATARAVAEMMVGTTRFGTAKMGFHDRHGRALLPGIEVAGKTGSLFRKERPFLAYSWFVGFAPAAKPEIAVAVLLGNGSPRDVKAQRVARDLLAGYFSNRPTIVAQR